MVEGKRIEIRAGRCDGTVHDCKSLGDYKDWTAGTRRRSNRGAISMRKALKRRHVLLSLIVAALATGVAPATASAEEIVIGEKVTGPGYACRRQQRENDNVKVCFQPDGEWIYVRDMKTDGRSAYGEVEGRDRVCRNPHGQGAWARCNYSFREGSRVAFRGFTRDNEGRINLKRNETLWTYELA